MKSKEEETRRSFRIIKKKIEEKISITCAEFVGSPIQRISFLSFEIMFIAMRTLSASYTRRRIFFWS